MPNPNRPALTGFNLLRDPRANQRTACSAEDRRALGIEGLLPPAADSLAVRIARVHTQLAELNTDLPAPKPDFGNVHSRGGQGGGMDL